MKTQIRICLTVEFKANFLVFRSAAALELHLPLVRPGCRTRKAVESLLLLDAREWRKMLQVGECLIPATDLPQSSSSILLFRRGIGAVKAKSACDFRVIWEEQGI